MRKSVNRCLLTATQKIVVESGLFKDGNGDGSIDCPQSPVKRQELAAVLDRAGILDYNIK